MVNAVRFQTNLDQARGTQAEGWPRPAHAPPGEGCGKAHQCSLTVTLNNLRNDIFDNAASSEGESPPHFAFTRFSNVSNSKYMSSFLQMQAGWDRCVAAQACFEPVSGYDENDKAPTSKVCANVTLIR